EKHRVPDSVLAVVEQRLMALDPESRRVLRAASVLGGAFWSGAVRTMLGEEDAGARLQLLVERELVHVRADSRFEGEREYAFRHDVVRAAAYAMLVDADRVLGHRLAAEWLEEKGEHEALTVAEHWDKAGEPQRAIPWFLRAAEQARDSHEWEATIA